MATDMNTTDIDTDIDPETGIRFYGMKALVENIFDTYREYRTGQADGEKRTEFGAIKAAAELLSVDEAVVSWVVDNHDYQL